MIRNIFIIVLWLGASWSPLAAQYQVDLNALTVDEGLSQNVVTTLMTESHGFLWIGTNDGLNRYDGHENRIFRRSITDSTTIASSDIYALAETHDHRIIVGHNASMISIYDPNEGRFQRYTNHSMLNPNGNSEGVYHIAATDDGRIYAVAGKDLLAYNASLDRFDQLPLPREIPGLRAVFPEADSTLVLFSFERTVHRYHLASGQLQKLADYSNVNQGAVLDYTSLGNNRYALALQERVYVYDAALQQVCYMARYPEPIAAITYQDGRLWASGEGNRVYVWSPDGTGSQPELAASVSNMGDNVVMARSITMSQDVILWLGTIGFGLSRIYNTSSWFGLLSHRENAPDALQSSSIRAIYPLSPHEVLIGGYSGLERYNFGTMQSEALLGGNSGNNAYIPFSITADPADETQLWIGTEGNGLITLDLTTNAYQLFSFNNGDYLSNLVQDLTWIDPVRLLLSTSNGLRIFDTSALREVIHPALTPWSGIQFSFVREFGDGDFYAGTFDGRLVHLRFSGEAVQAAYLLNRDYGAVRFLSMTKDTNGDFWMGTDNGLLHLDPDFRLLKNYTTESGLPNNTIYSVQFDRLGNLWMSTNLGISWMDVRNESFTNFRNVDGLQSNEFNRKSYASYRGEILFLGGIQGVNFFRPEQITSENRSHTVYIETLSASSGTYRLNATDMLRLPYTDNQVNIQFASPVFYNPRASSYWYRFANIDTTWRRNPIQNELILAGLQPGTYQLQLVRSTEASLHQAPVSEVWFRIQSPFYQLWYVQLGAILLIAGMVAFSVNSYLQKLRHTIAMSRKYSRQLMLFQDEERRRVAEALHDSIGSKLMLVKLSFRQVLMTVKDDFAEEKYQEINDLITDTVAEIREISQNIHPHLLEKIGVSKSIQALLESLQPMAQVRFTWSIDPIDDVITPDEALLFYRFVQESITNVIKHAQARNCHVLIQADRVEGYLLTEIRDDGIGIGHVNRNEPAETMGFRSFEERAAHLQAVFSVDSPAEGGTIIRLRKPLSSTV